MMSVSYQMFPAMLVTISALLAVGFGYVVFSGQATAGGVVWDLGFIVFSVAFLVSFVRLLWRHAQAQVAWRREQSEDEHAR